MSSSDKYLGFSIKEGQNKVVLLYEKAEYIQIIKAANTLGLSPASYLRMIAKPCEVCGHDSVIVNKLSRDIAKNFRGLASVQLYVFINELNLKNIQLTKLKLNHQLSFMLDIPKDSKIYCLERNRYNGSGDTSAVITVFRDGVKMASHLVAIKDDMVYKNND